MENPTIKALVTERIEEGDAVVLYWEGGKPFIKRAVELLDLSYLTEYDLEHCFLLHESGEDNGWRVRGRAERYINQLRERIKEKKRWEKGEEKALTNNA